ncbi:unnamed protein product, partial [Ixodes pacificus]
VGTVQHEQPAPRLPASVDEAVSSLAAHLPRKDDREGDLDLGVLLYDARHQLTKFGFARDQSQADSVIMENPATPVRGPQLNQDMSRENNYPARSITLYEKSINDRKCRFMINSGRYPKLAEGFVSYTNTRLYGHDRKPQNGGN